MHKHKLSELTEELLESLTNFTRAGKGDNWEPEQIALDDDEKLRVESLKNSLRGKRLTAFNEATVWARAIFPLLILAERRSVTAWSEVPLAAAFSRFSLEGVADGVLGDDHEGHPALPYLTIIEAKRGVEGSYPDYQLYGAMLAAARLNWQHQRHEPQVVFGCHTIADTWTFVRAEVTGLNNDKPGFAFITSREYFERVEAEAILGILKAIVAKWLVPATNTNR